VDLAELSSITKNYSGAEITGVIKSAVSFAFNRHVHVGKEGQVEGELGEEIEVCRDDFLHALDEVQAALGRSDAELSSYCPMGIIHFSDNIQRLIADGQLLVNQVRNSTRPAPFACFLLHGPAGSGKTALAAHLAMQSEYPYVKLLTAESMIGMGEGQRVQYIQRVFTDAHRSPLSLVIIDEIERLIDYVNIGPRFLNSVLQTLIVLMRKAPPVGHRLLIIASSGNQPLLWEMGMQECFTRDLLVPPVHGPEELARVIEAAAKPELAHILIDSLAERAIPPTTVSIPVKRALDLIEMAVQSEENSVGLFLHFMEPYLVYSNI
jgi:vesicle-fusing ATPase